jgi:hypothetical protein
VRGISSLAGNLSAPVADTGNSYRFSTLELLNESKIQFFWLVKMFSATVGWARLSLTIALYFLSFLGIFSKS